MKDFYQFKSPTNRGWSVWEYLYREYSTNVLHLSMFQYPLMISYRDKLLLTSTQRNQIFKKPYLQRYIETLINNISKHIL